MNHGDVQGLEVFRHLTQSLSNVHLHDPTSILLFISEHEICRRLFGR